MTPSPPRITRLAPNEIFVFGSNTQGRHGRGAAWTASQNFGAEYGIGSGRTGQCYAIATKRPTAEDRRRLEVMPLDRVNDQVQRFMAYARARYELTFLVTEIGCGLAGYKPEQIAPMFAGAPENVRLPQSFIDVIKTPATAHPPDQSSNGAEG